MPYIKLGELIRKARREADLSQADLGKRVGVSRAAISQWESGETKSLRGKNLVRVAQEGDQQATDTPVAVQERTNGLELRMRQAYLDQSRQMLVVQKFFQLGQGLGHLLGRGRYERSILERASCWANPVLDSAEFARISVTASDA